MLFNQIWRLTVMKHCLDEKILWDPSNLKLTKVI